VNHLGTLKPFKASIWIAMVMCYYFGYTKRVELPVILGEQVAFIVNSRMVLG
jgi:hypothetical protein